MHKKLVEEALSAVLEELADAEHQRWAHWQNYLHSQGVRQADGSLVIPAGLAARWGRQMATPYTELTEAEKESDREQVRKYLPLITKALCAVGC